MALITLQSPMSWPGVVIAASGTPNFSNGPTLDAAGEYLAYVFQARENMVISHVGFKPGTATGSPTLDVRIETVDSSGMPSGTLWDSPTNTTNIVTAAIPSTTYNLQALTAAATITKGQFFCVKIAYNGGTSLILQTWTNFPLPGFFSLPYTVTNTGTPTKSVINATAATISLGSSTSTFYQLPSTMPGSTVTIGNFNNTNSAKRGLRFTIPFNCRCIGLRFFNSNSSGDYNAVLFDDAGAELSSSSTAIDGDYNAVSVNGTSTVYFDNAVTLTAATTYRVAVEPSSATNATVATITLPSANYRTATALGTTGHYTTFATATWTDSATDQVPLMDILIDQIDDGTSVGGGSAYKFIGE